MDDKNGRTHEPNLRELTAQLDGFKDLTLSKIDALTRIIDERDRRYEDRFTAMDEKTGLALTSSEKAVTKAETATEKRFDAVNEFRGSLKDQADTMIPRSEANSKFKGVDDKIEEVKKDISVLRESRSKGSGKEEEHILFQGRKDWGIGIAVTIVAILFSVVLGAAGLVVSILKH